MNVKEVLHRLVDQLADSELETARKTVERLHVDLDEDPVSPEELVDTRLGANRSWQIRHSRGIQS